MEIGKILDLLVNIVLLLMVVSTFIFYVLFLPIATIAKRRKMKRDIEAMTDDEPFEGKTVTVYEALPGEEQTGFVNG